MPSKLISRSIRHLLSTTAFAQLDSSALRAKLGQPVNRETFHMPAGFDLIVDYGMTGQVCRIGGPDGDAPRDRQSLEYHCAEAANV